jgi:hypothetical protein
MAETEKPAGPKSSIWGKLLQGRELKISVSDYDLLFFFVIFSTLFCLVMRGEEGIGIFGLLQASFFFYFFESGGKGMRRPIKYAYFLFSFGILAFLAVAYRRP